MDIKQTNNRLEQYQSTIETEALRQSEQVIRASIGTQTKEIARQSVTQSAIAITEKIVRESINAGVAQALQEVGSAISKISQETSDRFALSVFEVQTQCSKQEQFELPTLTIETKSLKQSMDELVGEESGLSLQYQDKLKAIEASQDDSDLPEIW